MFFLQLLPGTEWKEITMGGEEWHFLPETIIRTVIMFFIILTSLRVLGKRGVKQLSVFELVVIIGLGSAAGDPMFYKDVGLLPAVIVFLLIIILYKGIIFLISKSKTVERLVEGKCVCLIKEGVFAVDNFKKESLSEDEFFAELRMRSVSHLGQVREAIIEISGEMSLFFYAEDQVKWGLSVMPGKLDEAVKNIARAGFYSCIFCGYTEEKKPLATDICPICKNDEWLPAVNEKRVS